MDTLQSTMLCATRAAHHNVAFLKTNQNLHLFNAAHATEQAVLRFLKLHGVAPRAVIDVGAGSYTYGRGAAGRYDESTLEHVFKELGADVHYYGFEPGKADFQNLKRIARETPLIQQVGAHKVHLFPHAVAGRAGPIVVYGQPSWHKRHTRNGTRVIKGPWAPTWSGSSSPNTRTTNPLLNGIGAYRPVDQLTATTLDRVASDEGWETNATLLPLFLKVNMSPDHSPSSLTRPFFCWRPLICCCIICRWTRKALSPVSYSREEATCCARIEYER